MLHLQINSKAKRVSVASPPPLEVFSTGDVVVDQVGENVSAVHQDGEQGVYGSLLMAGQRLKHQLHQVIKAANHLLLHRHQPLLLTTAATQTLLTVHAEHDLSLSENEDHRGKHSKGERGSEREKARETEKARLGQSE